MAFPTRTPATSPPSPPPPRQKPLSTRHTEKQSAEKQKRKKKTKKQEKWGGREGTQKYTRNKTRQTLEDISKLRTWKCVRIQLQASADRPAVKRANPPTGTTNKANHEGKSIGTLQGKPGNATRNTGNANKRYATAKSRQETPGTLKENTGNANNDTPLPRHAGNAQPMKPETLKLGRGRHKQAPRRHSWACSSLLTKLNTFNLM